MCASYHRCGVISHASLVQEPRLFYKEPEKLAKRQHVLRDTLLFRGVGALSGGIIGFFSRLFILTLKDKEGEIVLEEKNLVKTFGDYRAVDQLSFQINDGEIMGLIGQKWCW